MYLIDKGHFKIVIGTIWFVLLLNIGQIIALHHYGLYNVFLVLTYFSMSILSIVNGILLYTYLYPICYINHEKIE